MRPVLFEVPFLGWDVPGYGLALMVGFLLSIWWAAQRALKSKANPDVVLNMGFIALIGGVVGSRAMYVYHYWPQFAHQSNVLMAVLDVRRGGLEVYGGVIAVTLATLVYLWRTKRSIRWYLDIVAPSAALGMGIGRIGCFLNGCCWGGVCDLPWAVEFPYGSSAMVQQWREGMPGAGLPEYLVVFPPTAGDPTGTAPPPIYDTGDAAEPVPRELVSPVLTAEKIAKADQAAQAVLAKLKDTNKRLEAATNPQDQTRLRAEMQKLRSQQAQILGDYWQIRAQMARYHLTFEELRAIAEQHHSLPVHPTQLYSTITLVLLALLLSALYWRRTSDGQVICVFLIVEPITRWLLEVLRADNPVDTLGIFTVSQSLALSMSLLGLVGLFLLRYLPPRSSRAVPWTPPEEPPAKGKRSAPAAGA